MTKKIILTGIKATGNPHIGNYLGSMKPALKLADHDETICYYFIANYHALTSTGKAGEIRDYTHEVAATWLALGLDPEKVIFYRQSDIPEIFELHWILSCFCSKGLMNRAHAYKALVEKNDEQGVDSDSGINMGVYTYPILMSADILLFKANTVPVGADQVQHVEIARDIAKQFNYQYGETFQLPQHHVNKDIPMILGLDGRKMSKSYNNTIPLFSSEEDLRKLIFRIKTDSLSPSEPKDPDSSTLFQIYRGFATQQQAEEMKTKLLKGIGWGQVKSELFELMNSYLKGPRQVFNELISNKEEIDIILKEGAAKARESGSMFLKEVRRKIGV